MIDKFWLDQKGIALLSAVLIILIIFTLGTVVLNIAGTEKKIAVNQEKSIQALYLAEAGVRWALTELQGNPAWREGLSNIPLGDGYIRQVEVEDRGLTVRIKSQGEVQGLKRQISAEFEKLVTSPPDVIQAGLPANGQIGSQSEIVGDVIFYSDLNLNKSSNLTGNVLVEGMTTIDGYLEGSLLAVGDVKIKKRNKNEQLIKADLASSGQITGCEYVDAGYSCQEGAVISFPPKPAKPDFNWYQDHHSFLVEENSLVIQELNNGIYYAPDDLTLISENGPAVYNGKITVVSEGTVKIEADFIPEDPEEDVLVIIAQDVRIGLKVEEAWGILIAADILNNTGKSLDFFGAMQAEVLDMRSGHVKISYHEFKSPVLHPGQQRIKFELINWHEEVAR